MTDILLHEGVDISRIGSALSNPTRVNLLQLLSEGDYGAVEAYEVYNDTFEDEKHRESIYRELENLVDVGLIEKDYNQDRKQLTYSLHYRTVKIGLEDGKVEFRRVRNNSDQ